MIVFLLLLNLCCSKDLDTISDAQLNEEIVSVRDQDVGGDEDNENNDIKDESETEENRGTDTTTGENENELCVTSGGFANDIGLKTWCWGDVPVSAGGPENYSFSDGQLSVGVECNLNQVSNLGQQLRFNLDLNKPVAEWCRNDFNLRAEVSTSPWLVNHPVGTEEWFGWSYTFGDNYKIDLNNSWAFFQVHEGTTGETPLISLWSVRENGPGSGKAGELHVVNASGDKSIYAPTGIMSEAGKTVKIVVHVIWGLEEEGLYEVWMDDIKVYEKVGGTVRASNPVGGNAKFGIYKWGWRDQASVDSSIQQGIDHLETFMGPLRIITRKTDDPEYGKNSYDQVVPFN